MDIRSLQMFVAVVESRGFARAADVMGCSQPTVSAHIAALEHDLGATLVDRERRPIKLTPPGEAFLSHARNILSELEAARGSVSDFVGARRGTVVLGTYSSATAGYVPVLLRQFGQVYPNVRVQLLELGGAYIAQAATSGEVSLFLRQTTPPLSTLDFHNYPLWREDFRVVVPPEHELAGSLAPLPPATLLEYPLIMTGRYRPEAIMTHPFWHSLGEPPRIAYEVGQPQSLIELAKAGAGVGVTTRLALYVSRADGMVERGIAHPQAVRDVSVYWPRNRALSAAAKALRDFMIEKADLPACTTSIRPVTCRGSSPRPHRASAS